MENRKSELKSLQVLYLALLTGQVLFLGISFVVVHYNDTMLISENFSRIFQVLALGVAAAAFFIGYNIFKKRVQGINEAGYITLERKIEQYRAVSIIRWALMEGSTLFSIIGFITTSNYAFVILAAVMLFFFAGLNPTKDKLAKDLQLNENEIANLT
ncbi:MAG: hypothetical protein C5B52_16810 [Bacteroidetes bacterium]|nr:MAG: hypothetical protein C5B52_16810 [Bacteroidota bacterium]